MKYRLWFLLTIGCGGSEDASPPWLPTDEGVAYQDLSTSAEPQKGLARFHFLMRSSVGAGATIRMSDYFPTMTEHPEQILRRSYVGVAKGSEYFYLQHIVDPAPNVPELAARDLYRPENIEASHRREPGAQYYNVYDILKSGSRYYYGDTWHMRHLNGTVASITDSFVKRVNGADDVGCTWPTPACLGRANFYLGTQKLVFGGNQSVGQWNTTPANFSGNIEAWVQGAPGEALTYGPSVGYNIWSRVVVLEHYPTYTLSAMVGGKQRTYRDVIKVLHGHGAKYPGMVQSHCAVPQELSGLYWPKDHNSYYQVQWLAAGVGYIQTEVIYSEQEGCKGSWTEDRSAWSSYLARASTEVRATGQVVVQDLGVTTLP